MTDAELAALETRMITIPATLALDHIDGPRVDGDTEAAHGNACNGGAGELADCHVEASPDGLA